MKSGQHRRSWLTTVNEVTSMGYCLDRSLVKSHKVQIGYHAYCMLQSLLTERFKLGLHRTIQGRFSRKESWPMKIIRWELSIDQIFIRLGGRGDVYEAC